MVAKLVKAKRIMFHKNNPRDTIFIESLDILSDIAEFLEKLIIQRGSAYYVFDGNVIYEFSHKCKDESGYIGKGGDDKC